MENIIDRRLREWRSGAVRELMEIEKYAASIRGCLEDGDSLSGLVDKINELHSGVMSLISKADMSEALEDARYHQAIR